MRTKLTEKQIEKITEIAGNEKLAAFQEVQKLIESGVVDKDFTKEEADKIVKNMQV